MAADQKALKDIVINELQKRAAAGNIALDPVENLYVDLGESGLAVFAVDRNSNPQFGAIQKLTSAFMREVTAVARQQDLYCEHNILYTRELEDTARVLNAVIKAPSV